MSDSNNIILEKTASIVSAYVGRNDLPPDGLAGLIREVYQTLSASGQHALTATMPAPQSSAPAKSTGRARKEQGETQQIPAVDPRRSVFKDYIVCLEDGKKLKTLKRHLATSFNLSPEQYRSKWGLGPDYPMVAPNYAEKRSQLAKTNGLGRR
jgi:predicted transcriptional regulator